MGRPEIQLTVVADINPVRPCLLAKHIIAALNVFDVSDFRL
jgi:hypothetical protein